MKRTLSMIGVVLALVAVLALGVPAQPASAAKPSKLPDLQCGVPVTTSVKLSADLTCSTPVIVPERTPAVTVDLGGHTLRVDPLPDCIGRNSGYPICTFTDRSGNATLTNGTVSGNVGAPYLPGLTVTKVHVTGLANTGFYGGLRLTHDVVDGGIVQNRFAAIHDNVIAGGIRIADADAGNNLDIVGNRITGGISIYDAFDFDRVGGVISGNRIEGSPGAGISISGLGTNQMGALAITYNTIVGNAGDGISYAQYSYFPPRYGDNGPITLKNNVVRDNGGHGIDLFETTHHGAAIGVIDGGGNRARGNAIDPQCIGVRCGPPDSRLVPDVTWHNPPWITTETPLGPDQLNATSSVPGTFTYSPPAGALLPVGPWSLTVHFVPDDLVHYQPTDRAVTVFVEAPQKVVTTITWPTPVAIPYGTPLGPDQLNATASTPGTFTYTPAAGTVLPAGSHQISVLFVPDDPVHHTSASATVSLDVLTPPDQTLTWPTPMALTYGTPLGPEQLDAVSSVPGTLTYDPPSGTVLQVGGHPLTVTFTPDDPVHYSSLSATVSVVVFPAPGMITFEPPAEVLRGLFDTPTDVDLADLDGDGHQDVVTATPSLFTAPGYLAVNLGRGDGTFAASPDQVIPLGEGGHAVAAGDVNGDGHPDLVASNGSNQTMSVLLGNGDGTFVPKVDIPAGAGQGDIQLCDLDGDGNLDVVESNFTSASVTVLLGDGHGGFGPKVDYAVGGAPLKMAIADLDGDGVPDVTVANYLSNTVSVLDGRGDGTLAPKRELAVGAGPTSVVATDLDHDGALDLVTTDATDGTLSIRRGDGSGGFLPRTTVAAGQGIGALNVGDVDGDGEVDLLATNVSGVVSIWTGTGSAVPGPRIDVPTGPDARAMAVGDLDGDHRVDLVVARPFAFRLTVMLNRTPPLPSGSEG